jgi:sulfur-oxidizing protein SoxA
MEFEPPVLSRLKRWGSVAIGVASVAACATTMTSSTWQTRAIPESQGRIEVRDGKTQQIRYPWGEFGTASYEGFPTFAYDSPKWSAPKTAQMPEGVKGDPKKGHALMKLGAKGPCTACHLIPDATVWPAGNVGPDVRTFGARDIPDSVVYQIIYDPRVLYGPDSPMPPFGASGWWSPEEIVHVVAYLQSLKGNPAGTPEKVTDDKQWNPFTRDVVRPDYGDPLDPTSNPAIVLTEENAVPAWRKPGPGGKACADCHGPVKAPDAKRPAGVIDSMLNVGASYPKWNARHKRMMSVEDFISVHGPETTGQALPTQGQDNITMSILLRSQSNGMPYKLDTSDRNVQAAIARGQGLFHKKVGQRAHSCADCHTQRGGGNKFLGGRFLADIDKDAMINHPYYRTAQARLWDIRIRMQWCMTPLRTNMLPGDAPEYADLETYIISKQQGQPVEVPRRSH